MSRQEYPTLCKNGCGFYGHETTNNLCSKCYKDHLKQELDNDEISLPLNPVIKVSSQTEIASSSDGLLSLGIRNVNGEVTGERDDADYNNKEKKKTCFCCNKKIKTIGGFGCRCGKTFCMSHRLPETHSCTFDYKTVGRVAVAKDNPLVRKDKLETRI